jgi:hypothetical protein
MSRWMAAGLATLVLVWVGTAISPVPGAAQEPPVGEVQGEADVGPSPVGGGGQVTASDSACFAGTDRIWWSLRLFGEVVPSLVGTVPLAADGSWELSFTAPNEGGDWHFFALCLPSTVTPSDDDLIARIDAVLAEGTDAGLLEAWGVDGYLYYAHIVQVDGPMPTVPETPGTTTAPVAPPAVPVPGTPRFTG